MKLFVCLVIAVFAAVSSAMPSMSDDSQQLVVYLKAVQDCRKEEKPTPGDLRAIKNSTLDVLTHAGKCFVGCHMQKMGVIQNGVFSRENTEGLARSKLAGDQEKIEVALKYIDKCEEDIAGASHDKCVLGPILLACIKQFDAEIQANDDDVDDTVRFTHFEHVGI